MILNNQTFVMLTQAFSAAFDRGFKGFGVDQDWSRVASLENSGTKTGIYPYLGHFTKLREWIGDRQTQNFTQYGYQLVNRKFEATEEVQRTDIEDDQYGVYATAFQNAGASVKVWPDDLVYGGDTRYNFQSQTGVLGGAVMEGTVNACYDGQPFFSLNHPMGSGVAANYDNTAGTVGEIVDRARHGQQGKMICILDDRHD